MNWKDVPITDIVQFYTDVELRRHGAELWASCPLHNEKTPSFSVNVEKNIWHCFGCGEGGSGVDFLMKLRGIEFKAAAWQIEEDFSLKNEEWKRKSSKPRKTAEQIRFEREQRMNETIHQIFDWCLAARRAVKAELRLRGDNPPGIMIRDLGRLDCILDEIASADPERVAMGILFFRRWKLGNTSSRSAEIA